MTTTPDAPQPNIKWLAQQLRITVFHSAANLGDRIHGYWTEAFGSMPQQDETRNLEGVRVLGGQVGGMQWAMNLRPDRTDILAQPNVPATENPGVWIAFEGTERQAIERLVDPGHRLIDLISGINRLAVGTSLVAPGPDLPGAYAKLRLALPGLNAEPPNTADFLFRNNRRRQSKHSSSLSINRVATWSIAQGQTVSYSSTRGGRASADASIVEYAANLQLDINTVHVDASRQIPAEKAKDILTELVEMATEIAHRGDVI